jgi:DNA-binding NarL/FixJ family response regulator
MINPLSSALQSLRPNAEFSFTDQDINTIVWHTEGITTPSQAEIDAKIVELEAADAAKVDARQSALAKLAALGLTPEEIAAL